MLHESPGRSVSLVSGGSFPKEKASRGSGSPTRRSKDGFEVELVIALDRSQADWTPPVTDARPPHDDDLLTAEPRVSLHDAAQLVVGACCLQTDRR